MHIHLQPKQEQISDWLRATGPRTPTIIGGGGAKGGGKSGGADNIAIELCLGDGINPGFGELYPGFTITIVRRVFDDLKKNHIDPIQRRFPDLMPFYHKAEKEFKFQAQGINGKIDAHIVFAFAETEDDVKRKFLGGYETTILIIDEAQQFSQQELQWMQASARWTGGEGIPLGLCKVLMLFNPGGKGSEYIKRIFWTREYIGKEQPWRYAFQHMFGWDNYEWFRGQVDIEESDFYALPGTAEDARHEGLPEYPNRFDIFVNETEEGQKMNAYPESIRLGYLLGSFDHFAGQYFAGVWSSRCCISMKQIHALRPYWWTTWCGGDYGWGHSWTNFWACIGKVEPELAMSVLGIATDWALDIIIIYREFIPPERTDEAIVAQMIVDRTPKEERKEIRRWVMGADVNKTPRGFTHSINEMIEGITTPAGFPRISNANCGPGSRVVNARIMHEMLRRTTSMMSDNPPQDKPDGKTYPLLLVSEECPKLQSAIPSLEANPDNPEDVYKIDGLNDDLYDGCKYLLAEWAAVRTLAPVEVRRSEFVGRGPSPQDQYMRQLKFDAEESNRGRRPKRR